VTDEITLPQAPLLGAPRGAREAMPVAARRRQWLVHEVLDEFERWGYGRVETPLVEYYDVVARGLSEADRAGCVRFIEAQSGSVVALRADVTPQIARMVASRLGGELEADAIHRYCYAADVVRQPTMSRERTEQHQLGVELLGEQDAWADAELVALCDAALRRVGLSDLVIDVAHAQLARETVESLGLSPQVLARVHARLARKDRNGMMRALVDGGVAHDVASAVASLCDRVGDGSTVAQARRELGELLPAASATAFAAVVDALAAHELPPGRVRFDLGETRGFDYYSGMRMRVWARGTAEPIARGGRYDALAGRYGAARAATGFAIDLDALERAVDSVRGSGSARVPVCIVAVDPARGTAGFREAAAHARVARAAGARVSIQRARDLAHARAIATGADATAVIWIGEGDGTGVVHERHDAQHGWRPAALDAPTPTRVPRSEER
jgi:ATP phosphoribosyltransferase regulatory subunit